MCVCVSVYLVFIYKASVKIAIFSCNNNEPKILQAYSGQFF